MSDHSYLDFESFRSIATQHVPGLPPTATTGFDITRRGLLDHVQRVALRAFVLDSNRMLAPQAVDHAATLGELWGLLRDDFDPRVTDARGHEGNRYATPRVQLAPLDPSHYSGLYEAALLPQSAHRWRWRGRTPSPEEFQATLYAGVTSQFVVLGQDRRLVGLVVGYDEDPSRFHCHIGFLRAPSADAGSPGALVEGIALFIAYLFDTFPYERLFADLPEYNLPLLAGTAGSLLRREGTMRRFYWHGGRHWDRILFSLAREDWAPFEEVLFRAPGDASSSVDLVASVRGR